jgi:peptidoglycan hydrolase CwlO-like protein
LKDFKISKKSTETGSRLQQSALSAKVAELQQQIRDERKKTRKLQMEMLEVKNDIQTLVEHVRAIRKQQIRIACNRSQ